MRLPLLESVTDALRTFVTSDYRLTRAQWLEPGMPLSFRSSAVTVAFGTASFFMADENRTIRVDVPTDLLARIEGRPPTSTDEYVARLMRFRSQFGQIARMKYEDGQFEKEVNVLVVRITADDLL